MLLSDLGEPTVPGVLTGEDDALWLPGDASTFNRGVTDRISQE